MALELERVVWAGNIDGNRNDGRGYEGKREVSLRNQRLSDRQRKRKVQ